MKEKAGEREEKRRGGVTNSYLPVLAHHVVWEGRRSRLRGVATVVLCRLQQTLCCTILTGREDEGEREEGREGGRKKEGGGRRKKRGRKGGRVVVRLVFKNDRKLAEVWEWGQFERLLNLHNA